MLVHEHESYEAILTTAEPNSALVLFGLNCGKNVASLHLGIAITCGNPTFKFLLCSLGLRDWTTEEQDYVRFVIVVAGTLQHDEPAADDHLRTCPAFYLGESVATYFYKTTSTGSWAQSGRANDTRVRSAQKTLPVLRVRNAFVGTLSEAARWWEAVFLVCLTNCPWRPFCLKLVA